MKAILISIKPKWVAKILNGEKTIEIRKTMPKCDLPIDVYIYCTTTGKVLYKQFSKCVDGKMVGIHWNTDKNEGGFYGFNGRVVAKFTLNRVEEISYSNGIYMVWNYTTHRACITEKEMVNYLKGKKGYAWYISNLEIFDKPKKLREFKPYVKGKCMTNKCRFQKDYMCEVECNLGLTKAPQSWQFIEVGDK